MSAEADLVAVQGLQAPPFGMGFQREIVDLSHGFTPAGRLYRSFRYRYSGGLDRFDSAMLIVELPFSLSDVFWTTASRPRAGLNTPGMGILQGAHLRLWSTDEALAKTIFAAVSDATDELAMVSFEAGDLGIDGNQLVVVGPPADGLERFLDAIDDLVDALVEVVPMGTASPRPASGFGFYGHPGWAYAPKGDRSLLRAYGLRARHLSRVEDVISSRSGGVRMTAFRHTWVSDALNGTLIPRSVVVERDREQEYVCAFDLVGARVPDLSLNGDPLGGPVTLGNQRFIETFALRSTDPQVAYQLFNDRVREWLMSNRPYGWTVRSNRVRFHVPSHDPIVVGECERTLHEWLDRVPSELRKVMGLPVVAEPPH
jgi:hypothetical protein